MFFCFFVYSFWSYVFNLLDSLLSLDDRVCLCDDWLLFLFTTAIVCVLGLQVYYFIYHIFCQIFIFQFIFYSLAYLQINRRPQGWLCNFNQDECSDITSIGSLLIAINITLLNSLWYATNIYLFRFHYRIGKKIIFIATTTSNK